MVKHEHPRTQSPDTMAFRQSLHLVATKYLQYFPDEQSRLQQFLTTLQKPGIDVRERTAIPEGHMCASGIILSPNLEDILMVYHRSLNIWVVPGGHFDLADQRLEESAIREVQEETGMQQVELHPWHKATGIPLDIDTHTIPENPEKHEAAHPHYDFRFALVVPPSERVTIDPRELLGFQWVPYTEIDPNSSIASAIAKLHLLSDH